MVPVAVMFLWILLLGSCYSPTEAFVSANVDASRKVAAIASSVETANTSQSQSANWNKLTVPQLKSQLKERKLPVSGVKAELIKRIEEHESSHYTEEENTEERQSNRNHPISFPPPKDDNEIKVLRKEVQETTRMLDEAKLELGESSSSFKSNAANDLKQQSFSEMSFSEMPSQRMSRQQAQQEKIDVEPSLKKTQRSKNGSDTNNRNKKQIFPTEQQSAHELEMQHYITQLRLRPANDLKAELLSLKLATNGRKPDLVKRLAEFLVTNGEKADEDAGEHDSFELQPLAKTKSSLNLDTSVMSFAGIPKLSDTAATVLRQAFVGEPTPIQSVAIPKLFYPPNPSAILHAPTGSGKSIAFLLPITETLWREVESEDFDVNEMDNGIALILLPTRELAAQVAGVATVLAPPGMVRFVPRPMDLISCWKDDIDRGEEFEYFENEKGQNAGRTEHRKYKPRMLVGSAKSIYISLFGNKKMPGSPTNKPEGRKLLSCARWLVMDEVDRLLDVKKTRTDRRSKHEKPAAMLSAAIARLTMGRVQVISASATVGRPLRRELSRVLGLASSESPETLRGEEDTTKLKQDGDKVEKHVGRVVKIPDTVRNYVLPVDGSTSGSLLTSAAFASKAFLQFQPNEDSTITRKVLMVLTRNCDIKVHNAVGALQHWGIRPRPQSLLDALEVDGTDRLVEAHRKVSRVEGVGGEKNGQAEGYLLVTHEDNVRGLHLDGLDAVIVVGKAGGPDEYTHIAGRTGRAGRRGSVLNIVSFEQAAGLASWTSMLGVDFLPIDESEIASII